jgi:hypothetical protein
MVQGTALIPATLRHRTVPHSCSELAAVLTCRVLHRAQSKTASMPRMACQRQARAADDQCPVMPLWVRDRADERSLSAHRRYARDPQVADEGKQGLSGSTASVTDFYPMSHGHKARAAGSWQRKRPSRRHPQSTPSRRWSQNRPTQWRRRRAHRRGMQLQVPTTGAQNSPGGWTSCGT